MCRHCVRVPASTLPLATVLLAALLLIPAGWAAAGDWPQILGPTRSGKAEGERLLDTWPKSGPQRLWKTRLGSGYAGPAAVGERVIAFHRVGDQERVECFGTADGRSQWQADFPASYRGGVEPDTGPRCVPVVEAGRVFVFGAAGDLHAVNLSDGKKLWSRALYADYDGDEGYFGAGSTPIVIAGKLLVNVGGRGAGLVALDPATGQTLWKQTDEAASYSSPVAVEVGGQRQAIFITRMNCLLVEPASGATTLLFPFGQRGPTVNAAAPLVFGGKVFATASYNVGAVHAALAGTAARTLWANDETLSSQYATPVEHAGFLYGTHGREDIGVAELRCVEAASGRVRWRVAEFGVAHPILADGKLLLQKADGTLVLAAADPDRYRELGRADVGASPTRALPALASGRLYVRTGSGGGELHCLQVGR
jgi:outer membrane protein assembly factor BamB